MLIEAFPREAVESSMICALREHLLRGSPSARRLEE